MCHPLCHGDALSFVLIRSFILWADHSLGLDCTVFCPLLVRQVISPLYWEEKKYIYIEIYLMDMVDEFEMLPS